MNYLQAELTCIQNLQQSAEENIQHMNLGAYTLINATVLTSKIGMKKITILISRLRHELSTSLTDLYAKFCINRPTR